MHTIPSSRALRRMDSAGIHPRRMFHPAERLAILCVFGVALLHGLIYVFLVPPWGHYDEPTHFEYGWWIANRLRLPQEGDADAGMRREVAASMLEHGFFGDPETGPDLLQQGPTWIGISEFRHPPLYYLLVALPLRLLRHTDIACQLTIGRLVSLLLYLSSIVVAYGLVGELVPPEHALRWAVPGTMALLPSYTDLMTAVNSDVGAVVALSLFLWGAVRAIVRGPSLAHLAWIALAALLCVFTKNTASIALFLAPLVLALAWVRHPTRWWAWLGLLGVGLLGAPAVFAWGDAALWGRFTWQATPTSQAVVEAPLGNKALTLGSEPEWFVAQFLPREDVEALKGKTVTLGAWMWASQPTQVRAPLVDDGQPKPFQTVDIDVRPTFYTITTTLSPEASYVRVVLRPMPASPRPELIIHYDGLVLAERVWSQGSPPSFDDSSGQTGTWGGQFFVNRLRNGSAERTWLYMRPWGDRALQKYVNRSFSQFLASILDWKRTGWVYLPTAISLFQSFWARFGWNQIALPRAWYWGLGAITALGVAGATSAYIRQRRYHWSIPLRRAVDLLALSALLVWANTFLRFHPMAGQPFIPVARYAYPVIIPSVLMLTGGWWALAPQNSKRATLIVIFGLLGTLAIQSLWTLWSFYYGR